MTTAPDHSWVAQSDNRFAFGFTDGNAQIEGVQLEEIARSVGTPTFVYSADHIAQRYHSLCQAVRGRPTSICYAVKANGSLAILRHLAGLGAGADIVSAGELKRAQLAGIASDRIVFSGVGKTDDELDIAISSGLRSINIESVEELDRVAARAAVANAVAPVCIRVNPDVDPKTHPYLATGLRESKFGIAMSDAPTVARRAHEHPCLAFVGIACHIGSQIVDVAPYADAFARVRALLKALRAEGIPVRHLDLGGGLGIAYGPEDRQIDLEGWGRALVEATGDLEAEVVVEPGRFLVAQAGVLLTRVLGNKKGESRNFVIVDAAMNDLLRPALYAAYHAVVPLKFPGVDREVHTVDVVGPVCESGDFLAQGRALNRVETGEHLAVLSAGAYGMSMASTYNTRPTPAEVLVRGDQWEVTRARPTVDELLAGERVPAWLG